MQSYMVLVYNCVIFVISFSRRLYPTRLRMRGGYVLTFKPKRGQAFQLLPFRYSTFLYVHQQLREWLPHYKRWETNQYFQGD